MGTSYAEQIPLIIHVVQQLKPRRVLDVGKGFGKYGMLLHEYLGLDTSRRIDPGRTMKQQSDLFIDAVEVDPDLMLSHLDQFYTTVYQGDIVEIQRLLPSYDLILMVDVIEHIPKAEGKQVLAAFLAGGQAVLVTTPISFFAQHIYQSKYEEHVSHWKKKDFQEIGNVQVQYVGAGAMFLLTRDPVRIRGFGNGLAQRVRRWARFIRSEARW